jgi:hypothetical protein
LLDTFISFVIMVILLSNLFFFFKSESYWSNLTQADGHFDYPSDRQICDSDNRSQIQVKELAWRVVFTRKAACKGAGASSVWETAWRGILAWVSLRIGGRMGVAMGHGGRDGNLK